MLDYFSVQNGLKDAGDASPSGSDSLDVFAWFDEESSLKRLAATIARARKKVGRTCQPLLVLQGLPDIWQSF